MNRETSSRPIGLEGDGVLALACLALELAAADKGIFLVEEPEVHQHPSATFQSAKAILAAVRRGLQVIVSTHSLELIDGLLAEATAEDLARMATFRLRLTDGVLSSARYSGAEMATARREIDDDLR